VPELPEVETVRRSLAPRLTGRVVVRATAHRRDMIVGPGDPAGGFSRQREAVRPKRLRVGDLLQGTRFAEPQRRGKQLALVTEAGPAVVVHLGMTGQLRWVAAGARLDDRDHVHATWRLDDGSRLIFRDPRRFGGLWVVRTTADLDRRWAVLGPDGFDAPIEEVRAALGRAAERSNRPAKAVLLDQGIAAGIGNIYADEALHRAGVHPCARLAVRDADAVASAVRTVLEEAVAARGSTLRDYTDGEGRSGSATLLHRVYGRGGESCLSCRRTLERAVVAQRTTVWCPGCQPSR